MTEQAHRSSLHSPARISIQGQVTTFDLEVARTIISIANLDFDDLTVASFTVLA